MKKAFFGLFIALVSIFFIACGGGSGGSTGDQDIVVDPQAYYIDTQNGHDNNDGKTPENAWKSLEKVNTITLNPGNKILFRSGHKWIGHLEIKNSGTAANPIEIGAYGAGDKPVISTVGIQKIDKWYAYNGVGNDGLGIEFKEPVNDPANTWLAVILDSHPDRVKINGQELIGAYDSTELGNNFKWSYNRDKGGTVFYYYGNDKPNEIETNLDIAPLYVHDNEYITIKDITLEGGYVAGLFIENANNISVSNINVGNMSKQGIYVKAENSTVQNIVIDNCTIDSQYTFDYANAGIAENNGRTTTTRGASEGIAFWGGVQNSVVSNNTIKNWTHANINFAADYGEELSNNKIFNNTLTAPDITYGGRIGLDGSNSYNNEFYNNTVKNIKAPIQFNGHDNYFHDNRVENVMASVLKPDETGYGIVVQGYASPVYNNRIINNTFKNIAKDPIRVLDKLTHDVTNITIEPNSFE